MPGVRELFTREKPNAPKKGRVDLYRRINFEYYGLDQQEDIEMLEDEERYEKIMAKKDLDRWIEENKEYVKMKLKGIPNPTQEQLIELVDDESIEEYKQQHQTSKFIEFRGLFAKYSTFYRRSIAPEIPSKRKGQRITKGA